MFFPCCLRKNRNGKHKNAAKNSAFGSANKNSAANSAANFGNRIQLGVLPLYVENGQIAALFRRVTIIADDVR